MSPVQIGTHFWSTDTQAFRPKAMTYAAESQNTLLRIASRFQRTLTRTMRHNPFHAHASKSEKTTGALMLMPTWMEVRSGSIWRS